MQVLMQAHCIHRLRLILPSLTLQAAKITLQGVCLQIAFFCQGAWHGVFRRAVSPHCIHYINVSPSGRRPHALAHTLHSSYLYIYISQNIRLRKGDFEGQSQTTLQVKDINFLIYYTQFSSFAEFVKSSAFYTLLVKQIRILGTFVQIHRVLQHCRTANSYSFGYR